MDEPQIRGDRPHRPGPVARRWPRRLALALTTSLLVLGPWPVDDSPFEGADYARRTVARLDAMPGAGTAGPIRVGLAEVDLTPAAPRPLAGFIGQIRTPFAGVDTPCSARALTVESASGAVTILTADLLLINARMAAEVARRAEVRPDQVFFTASHTHSGPGGWGDHPLEMLVAGAYDPAYFDTLAGQLAGAVRRSRVGTEPAELGFVRVDAPDRQKNRVDPRLGTHDALSAFVFRPAGAGPGTPPMAILAVFGAHATVSHPVPPRLGGDYPAALAAELKRATGARSVLFAAGAVGDASPSRPKAPSSSRSAEALGRALAGDLLAALPSARFAGASEVAGIRLEVDLPPVRLPFFSPRLRFGPALTWWIADRRTHLHALRLGPAVLVGFPGDYSGHLAARLAEATRTSGLSTVATSFDGDYRGYLVAGTVFRRVGGYETRWMSFYGPWAGDYLTDLAGRMVGRLATARPPTGPTARTSIDLGPRIALAGLLGGLVLAARGRGWLRGLSGRFGRVAVGGILAVAIGFVIQPEWVAWSRVGLPLGVRLLGFPVGILALARAGEPESARSARLLAVASVLLATSWVIALLALRGWAVAGLRAVPGPAEDRRHVPAGLREAAGHQS